MCKTNQNIEQMILKRAILLVTGILDEGQNINRAEEVVKNLIREICKHLIYDRANKEGGIAIKKIGLIDSETFNRFRDDMAEKEEFLVAVYRDLEIYWDKNKKNIDDDKEVHGNTFNSRYGHHKIKDNVYEHVRNEIKLHFKKRINAFNSGLKINGIDESYLNN